jgi:hypothetical protein
MTRIKKLGAPVLIVLGLLIFFSAFLLFALFNSGASATPSAIVSAESYAAEVETVLQNADPANAETVMTTYGCLACHRTGAENNVAPAFVGIAEIAAQQRPPMPAAAYLYESIVFPGAYVVEGYSDVMPHDLGDRMTDQEIGDVIAYLLTPDAH